MRLLVGDKLPNFRYDTPLTADNELYETIGSQCATILFLRDSDCLFTAYHLEHLRRNHRYFKSGNRKLICVVQGKPEEFCGYNHFDFPLICDAESVLYRAFDLPKAMFALSLLSIEALRIIEGAKKHSIKFERSLKENVQLPVTILVNQDKTIEYIYKSQSLTDIPSLLTLLGGGVKNRVV